MIFLFIAVVLILIILTLITGNYPIYLAFRKERKFDKDLFMGLLKWRVLVFVIWIIIVCTAFYFKK